MASYQYQPQMYSTNPMQPVQQNYQQAAQQTTAAQPAQTAATTSNGMPSASAVNIVIQNPTAYPSSYPSNYYTQQPTYNMLPNNAYQQPPVQQQSTAATPVAAEPVKKDDDEKKTKKTKDVVQLTDDYIKTLENYLRNPNKDIRIMGAKELSKRFAEDDSRKGDKALNSLLNLVLQDKSSDIRLIGLAIANGGLAQGDDTTVQILKNMQSSKEAYGQDALSASQALLRMSGNTIKVPDNSPDKPAKSEKSEKSEEKTDK